MFFSLFQCFFQGKQGAGDSCHVLDWQNVRLQWSGRLAPVGGHCYLSRSLRSSVLMVVIIVYKGDFRSIWKHTSEIHVLYNLLQENSGFEVSLG